MRDNHGRKEKETSEKVRPKVSELFPLEITCLRKLRVDPGSIVEMENRIKRLESVIVASGLNAQSNTESPSEQDDTPPPDTAHVTDRLSTLIVDEEGTSRFLGEYDQ
jgi:hypothetical protein